MTERTETRRQQRRARRTQDASCGTDGRQLFNAVEQFAWRTCRRCYQPFRTTAYWDTCFGCWLADHDTPAA